MNYYLKLDFNNSPFTQNNLNRPKVFKSLIVFFLHQSLPTAQWWNAGLACKSARIQCSVVAIFLKISSSVLFSI